MNCKISVAILFVFCILQTPLRVMGQTNVGGTLITNTVWTVDESPYVLTSTFGVSDGVTLTINPGVVVQGNFDLLVKGIIAVNGEAGDSIIFNQTRLIFKSTNLTNSNISHVEFINASGVQLADESEHNQDNIKNSGVLTVANSEFNNNSYARTKGYQSSAKLLLKECDFSQSNIIKGYYPRSEIIEIFDCNIKNSTINSDSYNLGIFIKGSKIDNTQFTIGCCGASINLDNCEVSNSSFTDYNNYYNVSIDNSDLINTVFDLSSGHLSIKNSSVTAPQGTSVHINVETVDFNNSIFDGKNSSTGVKILGNQGVNNRNNNIQNCTFKNYDNAIEVQRFNSFNFKSNNLLNISGYCFINNWSSNLDATQNYWGTPDEGVIGSQIFDGLDDINSGIVDFSNYLTSPKSDKPMLAPQNVFKGNKEDGVYVTWAPNEQANLIGYKVYKKIPGSTSHILIDDVQNNTSYFTDQIGISDEVVITSYSDQADGISDKQEGNESEFSEEAEYIIANVTFSTTEYCEGDVIEASFKSNYIYTDNYFILQLSDMNGGFENAINLDSVTTVDEVLSTILPDSFPFGEGYLLRILSSELEVTSNTSSLSLFEVPSAEFTMSQVVCETETVEVQYNGELSDDLTLNWDFNGAEILENQNDVFFKISWSSTGTKVVTLDASNNKCSSFGSSSIDVLRSPSSDFLVQSVECEGKEVTVEYIGNGLDVDTYSWDFNGGTVLSGTGLGPYKVLWQSHGAKTVQLEVTNGECSTSSSKSVNISRTPTSDFSIPSSICEAEPVIVEYTGNGEDTDSYSWDFNGGIVLSGEGKGPYEIVWHSYGTMNIELEVSNNTCSSTSSQLIDVDKKLTSDFSMPSSICEGESAIITYTGNGIKEDSYTWDFDGGIVLSGEGAGPYEIMWNSFGAKKISLLVSGDGCTSELETESLEYLQYPAMLFEASQYSCYNEDYNIKYIGNNYTDMTWDFDDATVLSGSGAGPYQLIWSTSGKKVINFSVSNNGCSVDSTLIVNITPKPYVPEICMVTVDNESSKNKLVWNYDLETVSKFGVYKESNVAGEYTLLEYVNGGRSNTYIDNQSIPSQQPSRYKITSLDSCGVETELSSYHKTIHLTVNEGFRNSWNLIWDGYEGFSFGTYRIFRSLNNGSFELLTEVSSNVSSFTDLEVSSSNVAYQIEILTDGSCEVQNEGGRVIGLSSIKSNIARNNTVTGIKEDNMNFRIFPNPTSDFITVEVTNAVLDTYELTNLIGQRIQEGNLNKGNRIDIRSISSGTYLLIINSSDGEMVKKILKR